MVDTIYIKDWDPKEIRVKLEFKKPLEMSSEIKKDLLVLKIRPEAYKFFVSMKSAVTLKEHNDLTTEIPSQLPEGMA